MLQFRVIGRSWKPLDYEVHLFIYLFIHSFIHLYYIYKQVLYHLSHTLSPIFSGYF
jgi:hypothetical protein